jgi:hypothetical protein
MSRTTRQRLIHQINATKKQPLLNIRQLSAEMGPPVRSIRTWMHQGKIPFIRVGHRTCLFDPDKVREALNRLEVKAVGQ